MFTDNFALRRFTESGKKNNYISYCENLEQWCFRCVWFGNVQNDNYWLCAENFPEITRVGYSGHCDKFSTEKINFLKYNILKIMGFNFQSMAR